MCTSIYCTNGECLFFKVDSRVTSMWPESFVWYLVTLVIVEYQVELQGWCSVCVQLLHLLKLFTVLVDHWIFVVVIFMLVHAHIKSFMFSLYIAIFLPFYRCINMINKKHKVTFCGYLLHNTYRIFAWKC